MRREVRSKKSKKSEFRSCVHNVCLRSIH